MSEQELKMPVFDYSAPLTISVEDLEKEGSKSGSPYLAPGTYTTKITNIEYKGISAGDGSWGKVSLTLTAANDKTIRTFYMIPLTSKLNFGAKASTYPMVKLRGLLASAGLNVSKDADIKSSLQGAFADPAKSRLLGKEISITVGFTSPYVAFIGKDTVALRNADGSPHAAYGDRTWSSKDALLAEMKEAGVKVGNFPEVVKVEPAARAIKSNVSNF